MTAKTIDINCDMGESYGAFKIGNDEAIFPYITSCNIACGFHGGDPLHIENTIKLALKHGVRIGAHPSYPDLAGFGRRKMELQGDELKAILKYQISALKGMTESLGGRLAYVKPHGALYNIAANDETECRVIIDAIREIDPTIIFMGLAGSVMEEITALENIPFVAEAFADRRYESNGRLMSRNKPGAVIEKPEEAVQQVLSLVLDKQVKCADGKSIYIHAKSICIHGDNPGSVAILRAIDQALRQYGIYKNRFSR